MIPGLTYIKNFITVEKEQELLAIIQASEFENTLSRRTQQYGYTYSYGANAKVIKAEKEVPREFSEIISEIGNFNQVIVNEYTPGQGIGAHTDHIYLFGDTIVSVSLLSPIVMTFTNGSDTVNIFLEARSAVILKGDARYKWKHSIASRKSDTIDGVSFQRSTRISITFRNVKNA